MLDIIFNHTYTVTLFTTLFGQQVINRFSYVVTTVGTTPYSAEGFLNTWWTAMEPVLAAIQHDKVLYVKAQVFHLGGTEGTFEKALSGGGDLLTATYDPAPSWLTLSFRQFTEEGISRSGWKRIAGLLDVNVVDNALDLSLGPDLDTAIAAFQSLLESSLSIGSGNVIAPAVTRLIEGSSPPAYAGFKIIDTAYPFLGSQVSRKPGHGD